MSLKSTGHHNTGTRPEEVEKEPMVMTKVQEQQWQATMKAKMKVAQAVFSTLLFFGWQ
jgi:hypothetical protein